MLEKFNNKFSFAFFNIISVNNKYYITCYSLYSFYLNKNIGNFFYFLNVIDFEQKSLQLLSEFLDECFNSSDNEHIIYFHNLSKSDGFLILNLCLNNNLYLVSSIIKNNIIYEIKIFNKKRKRLIIIKDTFLLFPLSFTKFALLYNYKIQDFSSSSISNYSNILFLKSLIKSCKFNAKILSFIFFSFCKEIYGRFAIYPFFSITLASLAFKIYRSLFYSTTYIKIYKNIGPISRFLQRSYRGGIVNVYKPYLEKGYHYDVNSLYPYVMRDFLMPVNQGIYGNAEFDSFFNIADFFGFIEVEVFCPSMYIPFLAVQNKVRGLITPIGTWTDVYFSEEIKYALTLGYSFKYKNYYKYDKAFIFKDYVESLYNIRLVNKNNALNTILKLLLNSLYGRFGMSTHTSILKLKRQEFNNLHYNTIESLNSCCNLINSNFVESPETNTVHIASAITSYGRIYMHKLKHQYSKHVYYSDTDSLILDCPLDNSLVSETKMGYLKLERTIDFALFIAPKIYYIKSGLIEIKKFRGLSSELISFKDYIKLYNKETFSVITLKNYIIRSLNYKILQKEVNLTLTGKFFKRTKRYKNKIWIDTSPLKLFQMCSKEQK